MEYNDFYKERVWYLIKDCDEVVLKPASKRILNIYMLNKERADYWSVRCLPIFQKLLQDGIIEIIDDGDGITLYILPSNIQIDTSKDVIVTDNREKSRSLSNEERVIIDIVKTIPYGQSYSQDSYFYFRNALDPEGDMEMKMSQIVDKAIDDLLQEGKIIKRNASPEPIYRVADQT